MLALRRVLALALALVAPAALAQGLLIPTDTSLGPLGIKYQRVTADIKDGAAVTKVEQVFVNDGPRQLEAHFVFPLPKGAALSEFYLWINGVKTKGEVMEKQKATAIYEGIVRRLQDPGLLEYIDHDVFRARVFPVPARGEQRIELSFSQVLEFQGGLYRYHYPLGAGSRGAPRLAVRQDFTFSASINSKVPIRSVYSPTHPLAVSRKGENAAVVGMEQGPGADISKDLDLYYTVSDRAVGLSLLAFRSEGEPGYFLALIAPRAEVQKEEIIGKRITFVVDTSGSMMGDRMKLARESLRYCVTRLNPQDRFNVVRFSTDVEALFEAPKLATPEAVKKAVSFVDSLEALGGTAIDEGMRRALKDGLQDEAGPHIVLFITDGKPTVGETDEEAIAKNAAAANKGRSRVFTFGVGEDLNARLLDRLAAEGTGTSDFVRDGKEFEVKISGFYDKVSHPVLSDLGLDLSSIAAYDVYPRKLPDLFKGSQLVVMGRYREPGDARVKLTGKVNGQERSFEYGATAPKERKSEDFIPRLWAIRKVGYLLEEIRLRGERPELRDEVVTLGKRFGIVTPYTSYLVVEDQAPPVVARRERPPPPPPPFWDRPRGGGERGRFAPAPAPSAPRSSEAPAASAAPEAEDFAGLGDAKAADVMGRAEGKSGIAVSKKMKEMKEEQRGPAASDPVRVAGGRTYVFRSGGWIDSEVLDNPGTQLKVKYMSAAYFALLRARPDLKAALALGDRVVVVIGKGKTIVIAPDAGEEGEDKLQAFLK
ncbi:MAG: VWA domain-containing protein [Myxococcales bacterium]|nr:VWA domain-containing protein [Myxococcales bacterium]